MTLGLVFLAIGLVWLPFRKGIARRQYSISSEMLGRKMPRAVSPATPAV